MSHAPYMVKILSSLPNKLARENFINDPGNWKKQDDWSNEKVTCEHLSGFNFLRFRFNQHIPGIGTIQSMPIYWRIDLTARLMHQVSEKEIEDHLKQKVYDLKMERRQQA